METEIIKNIKKRLLALRKKKEKEKKSKLFKEQMKLFKKETSSKKHKRSNSSVPSNSIWAISVPMGGESKWKRKK